MDKKAVSVMIGYVLLISSAVVIGAIVYQFLKGYVPNEGLGECPEGTSLIVKEFKCYANSTSGEWGINLTVKNNGRFGLDGYFIKASNSSDQEIATKDLSKYIDIGKNRSIVLIAGGILPGKEIGNMLFNLTDSGLNQIYFIDLIPAKEVIVKNRKRTLGCTNAKIREDINCAKP